MQWFLSYFYTKNLNIQDVCFCDFCECVCLSVYLYACLAHKCIMERKDKEKELSQATQSIIAAAMLIAQYSGKNSV